MAPTQQQLDDIVNRGMRMQALRLLKSQVKVAVNDNPDAQLKPAVLQTMKDDWQATYDTLWSDLRTMVQLAGP